MRYKELIAGIALALAVCALPAYAREIDTTDYNPHTFSVGNGTFLLDGKPFVIKAAELHYPRIPRAYREHRIKMCKALGMNTICLYVFWNLHEPRPGEFDFSGDNDLAEFVRLCRDNGMYVILRPGPYVCAEWEMGGLPWWLLQKRDIRLRENDPYFLERVDKFQHAVAQQLKGLMLADGGPIIMVQVENEYGSYGKDKPYVSAIRDLLRKNFGENVMMFQCDWASNFLDNGLDDLVWSMNFGTGADIDSQFAKLREVRPQSPLICSEYWSGWFDKWGASHETRPASEMTAGIDEMLSKSISFSLYMTHGGTNFGHWAGANSPGYAPDVTSYDYDAPINEQGAPTPKYHALRAVMAKYHDGSLPAIPEPVPLTEIPEFSFTEVAPLFANLPTAQSSHTPMPMEMYGQGFGSILYSTTLPRTQDGTLLTIEEPHDFAQVFIDGTYIGKLDRRLTEKRLTLPATRQGARLDILVEATGRINFGRAIKDYKGITERVTLQLPGDKPEELTDWQVYCLEDSPAFYDTLHYIPLNAWSGNTAGRLPAGAYRATFHVEKPADTFLDFETWGKGLVYVNGHAMGRIWEIGPQQTLYMPGCLLREGENEIMVFDIAGPKQAVCRGLLTPINNKLQASADDAGQTDGKRPDLSGYKPVAEAVAAPADGIRQIDFAEPAQGRFLCLEILSGDSPAAIAELYACGTDGERLPREAWRVCYVDSEDKLHGNHGADKLFDLQESTYWSAGDTAPYPHIIVIDLGEEQRLGSLLCMPRMEPGAPGAISHCRVYLGDTYFEQAPN